ncbi:DUF397 domain-containing protein [Embleya sp. NPDC050493]|uniref:DUF397 domain-containing protein n=1 Tax=Embleya sp. NPDC050493 TaxID=3363989 RepID=UPI0037ACCA81
MNLNIREDTVRKSSHSGAQNDCVEAGSGRTCVGVRDTKHRVGGFVVVPDAAWQDFLNTHR